MMKWAVVLYALSLFTLLSCKSESTPDNTIEESSNSSLKKAMEQDGLKPSDLLIHIDKTDLRMRIKSSGKVLKEYPVVFGPNFMEDKLREGDKRTPEGIFGIRDLYPHKSWSKFIWIDYPNENSWKKHKAAVSNGTIPANSKIGGEIGIHGVPEDFDHLLSNETHWTLGCISMTNADVDELYSCIDRTTMVEIVK